MRQTVTKTLVLEGAEKLTAGLMREFLTGVESGTEISVDDFKGDSREPSMLTLEVEVPLPQFPTQQGEAR